MDSLNLQTGKSLRFYARRGCYLHVDSGSLLVQEGTRAWADASPLLNTSHLAQDEALIVQQDGWVSLIAQNRCELRIAAPIAQSRGVIQTLSRLIFASRVWLRRKDA